MEEIIRVESNLISDKIINCLPNIFLVATWARTGYLPFKFNGTYNQNDIPMVWNFNGHNGRYNEWELVPITEVTTAEVHGWAMRESEARSMVESHVAIYGI